MGEAKRRALVDELTKRLVDDGRLVEAGWQSLRLMSLDPEASPVQLDEMRMAFFAGAQHLFGSMMSFMEKDEEPTDNDLRRMDAVQRELDQFIAEFKLRIRPSQGKG